MHAQWKHSQDVSTWESKKHRRAGGPAATVRRNLVAAVLPQARADARGRRAPSAAQLTNFDLGNDVDKGEDISIDLDVYGATIFSVIYDMTELLSGVDNDGIGHWMNLMRMTFVLMALLANFTLQIGMLYWVYSYVVRPSLNVVQLLYQKYHAELWVNGTYRPELWDAWIYKEQLCSMPFSNFGFMYAIMSLWWLTMVNEFRKNERLLRNLGMIPNTLNSRSMIETGEDGIVRFKNLTPPIRMVLYVVLITPKLLISVALLVIGSIWLTATQTFADLVLNAIQLEFVISIDELLFEALLPAFIRERIQEAKLWRPGAGRRIEHKRITFMHGYRRSLVYFIVTFFGVYAFLTSGQDIPMLGVFPGYAHDIECDEFRATSATRLCTFGRDCFPIS